MKCSDYFCNPLVYELNALFVLECKIGQPKCTVFITHMNTHTQAFSNGKKLGVEELEKLPNFF